MLEKPWHNNDSDFLILLFLFFFEERVIVASEYYRDNLLQRIKAGSVERFDLSFHLLLPPCSFYRLHAGLVMNIHDYCRNEENLIELSFHVLSGLSYLNSIGMVHRCLSPKNIVFNSQVILML